MNTLTKNTDLELISTRLVAFEAKREELILLAQSCKDVDITSIDDKAALAVVSTKRKALKAARVDVEKQGKSMRDMITPVAKHISAKEKELVAIISPEEERLASREQWVEAEQERIRAEKAEAERQRINDRIHKLSVYNVAVDYIQVLAWTDEQFLEKLTAARIEFEAEAERLEKVAREAAEAKAAEEAKMKAEREELQKLRAEQAEREIAMKAQADKIEADRKELEEQKARHDKAAKEIRYNNRVELLKGLGFERGGFQQYELMGAPAISFHVIDEADDAAWISIHDAAKKSLSEYKEKEEATRKEAAQKALADKAAKEEKERKAEQKRIARMPETERIILWMQSLGAITVPKVADPEMITLVNHCEETLNAMYSHVKETLEAL
jgi:hypothetical protein